MRIHQQPEGGWWNDPATWIEGVVPTKDDIVLVQAVTVMHRDEDPVGVWTVDLADRTDWFVEPDVEVPPEGFGPSTFPS